MARPDLVGAGPVAPPIGFDRVWAGMRGKVVSIDHVGPDTRRLQEMGLSEGAEFTVLEVAPFGDPVQILVRGYRLCLRRREAAGLRVEEISG